MQLAYSCNREYETDRSAAVLSGDPAGLIFTLQKLEYDQRRRWEGFFLPGQRIPEPSLLRTHPPTDERIQRLRSLQAQPSPTLGFADALGQDFLPQASPPCPPLASLGALVVRGGTALSARKRAMPPMPWDNL